MPWSLPAVLSDNRFADGVPVSSTAVDVGYSVLNLIDWRPFTFWRVTGTGTHFITIDCGSARSADTLAILAHNLASLGATVSVECSSDNFAAETVVALAGFVPASDRVIYRPFTAVSRRYWRLRIVISGSFSPYLGILCVGARVEFPYQPDKGFDPWPQTVKARGERSTVGQLLGVVRQYVEIAPRPTWTKLDPAWVAATFEPWWDGHASKLIPFFWSWEPGEHAAQTLLVSLADGFTLSRPLQSGIDQSISLELVGVKEV